VLPAHQRLEAESLPGLKRDDGLVLDEELVAINGAAQVGFQLQHVDGVRVHAFVEDDVARLAQRTSPDTWRCRRRAEIFGALVADVRERDADAGGREGFVAVQGKWLRHLPLNALGDLNGFLLVAQAVEQNGELVAAQARDLVAGAHAMAQALGDAD
jgi:hypothetical protein